MAMRLAEECNGVGKRAAMLLGVALAAMAMSAAAGDPATTLPEVVVHGAGPSCDGARASSLECLNTDLARSAADQAGRKELEQLAGGAAPPAAENQVGLYNQAAVRQRLGSNFGHSARPAQNTAAGAANPVLHRTH